MVGAHEYFTSAKCPRQDCDNFLRQVKGRTRYCQRCKVYFDRDAVGSENIARVCQAQIVDGRRPEKYKPKEDPKPKQWKNLMKSKRPGGLDLENTGPSKAQRLL